MVYGDVNKDPRWRFLFAKKFDIQVYVLVKGEEVEFQSDDLGIFEPIEVKGKVQNAMIHLTPYVIDDRTEKNCRHWSKRDWSGKSLLISKAAIVTCDRHFLQSV